MKLFNYEEIYLAARGDPLKIVKLFLSSPSRGDNWVMNEKAIVEASKQYPARVVAEYIGICSLRPRGVTTLRISELPPWIPHEVVKNNPLITVDEGLIIFNKEK